MAVSDAHVVDYQLFLDGTVCDGRPPVLLDLMRNNMAGPAFFLQEMWS
jgi:hypothetical protein